MSNLVTMSDDFTVDSNGNAFVSQRKAAQLCGIDQSNISRFIASNNIDAKQGLTPENLSLCITNYAQKGKVEAIQTLILFTKAGAKAYIYSQAGYTLNAVKPQTHHDHFLEWSKLVFTYVLWYNATSINNRGI